MGQDVKEEYKKEILNILENQKNEDLKKVDFLELSDEEIDEYRVKNKNDEEELKKLISKTSEKLPYDFEGTLNDLDYLENGIYRKMLKLERLNPGILKEMYKSNRLELKEKDSRYTDGKPAIDNINLELDKYYENLKEIVLNNFDVLSNEKGLTEKLLQLEGRLPGSFKTFIDFEKQRPGSLSQFMELENKTPGTLETILKCRNNLENRMKDNFMEQLNFFRKEEQMMGNLLKEFIDEKRIPKTFEEERKDFVNKMKIDPDELIKRQKEQKERAERNDIRLKQTQEILEDTRNV